MGLDIRWPIGLMFTLIGVLLSIYGAVVKSDHAISLGININLIWGLVLLVFGVFMLVGAIKGSKTSPSA
jgi:hypothetical protein